MAASVNPFVAPLEGANELQKITENVSRVAETKKPPKGWYIAFAIALSMLGLFGLSVGYLFWEGW